MRKEKAGFADIDALTELRLDYHCDIDGSFDWFQGKETIKYQGKLIYECYFHGGLIS